MGDATSLRAVLSRTDNTAPSIQSSAGAMMRLYDRSPSAAVTEWRNSLQTCRPTQLLPLLYVANEVLQNSKRNRGNRFLEAFSPVLGSSLQYICERDRGLTEKVRRTAKIWGDRRVFSVRYVGELLGGLERFRGTGGGGASSSSAAASSASTSAVPRRASPTPAPSAKVERQSSKTRVTDDEDDDDLFGGSRSPKGGLLDVNVMIDRSALTAAARAAAAQYPGHHHHHHNAGSSSSSHAGVKRRRSSGAASSGGTAEVSAEGGAGKNGGATSGGPGGSSSGGKKRRPRALSTQSFLDLLHRTSELDDTYKSAEGTLASIPASYLSTDASSIEGVFGDELTEMHRGVTEAQRTMKRLRKTMHGVATERKGLETDATRYVKWLRGLVKVDVEELVFCDRLEEKLKLLQVVHADARAEREKRREEDARKRAEEEERARREAEETERRESLKNALGKGKEMEVKPGMVWNKELREYQYLHDHTEESWRD